MKIGLIGLPLTGKTTLFNLLTGNQSGVNSSKYAVNLGTAKVPDRRIDFLSNLYQPRKTTYAQIDFIDIAGLLPGGGGQKSGSTKFLHDVRGCDVLVHVLRAFTNPEIAHVSENINPVQDLETVETELLFADLELIEKRKERINTSRKITKEDRAELERLEKCSAILEDEKPLSEVDLSVGEKELMKNYAFLTEKPCLAVVNVNETQFQQKEYPYRQELLDLCQKKQIRLLEICAQMEWEISVLGPEDRLLFMADLGLEEAGIELLARNAYEHLGLLSFFTVGEDEVKAWTITRGTVAKEAAGKIHSDIERGFIRAEVVKYEDLERWGTMALVKEKGLFRLEGKTYLVEDGDLINFRFNV